MSEIRKTTKKKVSDVIANIYDYVLGDKKTGTIDEDWQSELRTNTEILAFTFDLDPKDFQHQSYRKENNMGMFSWECKGCGKSILSIYSISEINQWMMDMVAMYPDPDKTVLYGTYDGYGRIYLDLPQDGAHTHILTPDDDGVVEVWHRDCWDNAKQPGYTGPSEIAGDQGFDFGDEDYAISSPLSTVLIRTTERTKGIKTKQLRTA